MKYWVGLSVWLVRVSCPRLLHDDYRVSAGTWTWETFHDLTIISPSRFTTRGTSTRASEKRSASQLFSAGKNNANLPNILVYLQLVCHFVVMSKGLVGRWEVATNNWKLTHDFTTSINSKYCSICYRLAVISRGSFVDLNSEGLGELGGCETTERLLKTKQGIALSDVI